MKLNRLHQFQNFWPTANNSITHSNPLFHEKVCCPNLEVLLIDKANSTSVLCSHQLPVAYFSKLVQLKVYSVVELRNLMSLSVARGILNLRLLQIVACISMEEVITEEEQQGEEIMINEPLFSPVGRVVPLRSAKAEAFLYEYDFPFLRVVWILNCPEMKTFVQ
uniref:Disease resistance protein At4g27190-like leucine-rich repeats domain-containing protein n=1 Tax=Solanum lycopersicum TaxID=4081 RepID=A0A3Q7JDM5_SOLLC